MYSHGASTPVGSIVLGWSVLIGGCKRYNELLLSDSEVFAHLLSSREGPGFVLHGALNPVYCANLQGDSISRVFDDPKGLFASAPVNAALTKSKSRDSTEKLLTVGSASVAAAAGYAHSTRC